jgi:signal transduction histidine kinase
MSAPKRGKAQPVEEPRAAASGAVRAAAAQVAAHWSEAGFDRDRAAEVVAELGVLAQALESGAAATLPRPDGPQARLRRRLLGPLWNEVVRAWTEAPAPPEGAEMVSVLRGLEQLRRAVEPGPAGLSPVNATAPEGFELMVELAHDLRSPLTSILFLSETLRRAQSGEVNDLQKRQLGLIYSAALGMVSLASDLIELAHGGDRLVDSTPSPFSVSETLQSVCDMVRPLAEEKKIALRVLPPEGDQRIGHSAALNRALLNLVSNALRYTDDGFVEITTRARGMSALEFSVRDTGPGIGPEARASLFEPFRRTDTSGDRYGFSGTGLGLTITRHLVHAMGSELHMETRPGWGTLFRFELELPLYSL